MVFFFCNIWIVWFIMRSHHILSSWFMTIYFTITFKEYYSNYSLFKIFRITIQFRLMKYFVFELKTIIEIFFNHSFLQTEIIVDSFDLSFVSSVIKCFGINICSFISIWRMLYIHQIMNFYTILRNKWVWKFVNIKNISCIWSLYYFWWYKITTSNSCPLYWHNIICSLDRIIPLGWILSIL